ncbi:MAG: acetylxylan esterase [Candidatus Rifleibacteriota bacterium]
MEKKNAELNRLLRLPEDKIPDDFARFWQQRYEKALEISPRPKVFDRGINGEVRVFDLEYRSTGQTRIHGWMTLPAHSQPRRGFVVLHGYGGRTEPDFHLPFSDSAVFYPCCRGLGRSISNKLPSDPQKHVLYGIESRENYIIGGCVEDTWTAISSLIEFFPELQGKIGLLGSSFGGGIATLAAAWDKRANRIHTNVASFAFYRQRMNIPTVGSAAALQKHYVRNGEKIFAVLDYFDSAFAAAFVTVPAHCACAVSDKVVSPESQFAIYNRLSGSKKLFVLDAGHCNYPGRIKQENQLTEELREFFNFL